MNAKRAFFGMVGVIGLLVILGIACLVLGNKVLASKTAKLVDLKLQDQVLSEQQTALEKAKKDVTQYTPLNTVAETIVPQDKDQALTVREIVDFAGQANIKIGSITFPASNLGQLKSSSSKTPPSQVLPVSGIKGIYQLPITVVSDTSAPISYNQLISFLQKLENNRHTAQVSQLTITPSDTNGKLLTFQLVVNVYIKP